MRKLIISLFACLCLGLPALLRAQESPRPIAQEQSNENIRFEEGIDPVTGGLKLVYRDIHIPGPAGLNIDIHRVYDIQSTRIPATSSYPDYRVFDAGYGWSIGAAPKLSVEVINATNMTAYVICTGLSDWSKVRHLYSVTHSTGITERAIFVSPTEARTASNWRLTCSGNLISLTSPAGVRFEMGAVERQSTADWTDRYYYYHTGSVFKTTKVQDLSGNSYSIQYAQKNISGYQPGYNYVNVISSITASDGRSLAFEYTQPSDGRAARLSAIVLASGARFTYTYFDDSSFVSTSSGGYKSGLLSQVKLPDSSVIKFHYGQYAQFNVDWSSAQAESNKKSLAESERLIRIVHRTGGSTTYSLGFGSGLISKAWITDHHYRANPNAANEATEEFHYSGLLMVPYGGSTRPPDYHLRVEKKENSNGGTWLYSYEPSATAGVYDKSSVTDPAGVITTYYSFGFGFVSPLHFGMRTVTDWNSSFPDLGAVCNGPGFNGCSSNVAWKIGLIMEKTVGGTHREIYSYTSRTINSVKASVRSSTNFQLVDFYTAVPTLTKTSIIRDGAQYVTDYLNHDVYGNPGTIVESGPNGGTRTTTLTYFNDPAKWIIGRRRNETFTGGAITRSFDARGNVLSQTRDGVVTTFTYDAQGNLATKTLPRGLVHTFTNYKRGVPQTEVQPEGVNIERVVSDAGNVLSERNGDGYTTAYSYDDLNRVTAVVHPRGYPRTIAYTPTRQTVVRGNLVETTNFDEFGKIANITLGGITTYYAHDAQGRVTFKSNPGTTVGTNYQYDALDRPLRITNADGTYRSFSYGAASTSITDERGQITTSVFRSYGNPTQQYLMAVWAPEPAANLALTRNARDLVTSVTQGGVVRTYLYDSRYFVTSAINPETGATNYGRDDAGNMVASSVGGSGTTLYAYDGRNRLVSITYPIGAPSVSKTYTKTDRLYSVSSDHAYRRYGYDENGNLVGESLTVDGITLAAGYGYTANDQLASVVYPGSGRAVSYYPDVLGRPTQVSGYATAVSHWPSGQLALIQLNNGTVSNYGQNNRLWPSAFSVQNSSGYLAAQSYVYDGAGNLTQINDSIDANYNRTLGYDAVGRLTGAAGPWGSGAVSYDAVGNVTGQAFGSYALSYGYDAYNRLASVAGAFNRSYGYDARGNVASHSGRMFEYNAAPNLVCSDCSSGLRADFRYDGLNSRVSVTRTGVTSYEFHNSNGQLLVEYTPSQGKLVEFIYLGSKRVAEQGSGGAGTVAYYHPDLSGSPLLSTGTSGQLLWKENYLPYGGKRIASAASTVNRIGFHGKPFDDASGLSYQGARYYDPIVGRFTGVDPKSFDPDNLHSFNVYAYGNNNPYRFVDPDGRSAIDIAFLVVDVGKLGVAAYTGVGIGAAAADVAASLIGVVSPVPFVGQSIKVARATDRVADVARAGENVIHATSNGTRAGVQLASDGAIAAKEVTAGELRAVGRADFNASRAEALVANGGKCTYCDKAGATAGDHVKSLKSFADDVNAGKISRSDAIKQANSRENITGACTSCNSSKGSRELSPTEGPGKWVAPNGFHRQ